MGIVIEPPKDPAAADALAQELADRAWDVIEVWDEQVGDVRQVLQAGDDVEDAVRALDAARTAYLQAVEPKVATRPPLDPSGEA